MTTNLIRLAAVGIGLGSITSLFAQDITPALSAGESHLTEPKERFTANKDNYFLPAYYESKVNQARFEPNNPNDEPLGKTLIQFQFSIKYRIARFAHHNIYLGYSQRSNWQAYADSAYFRDSDYNPEIYYLWHQPKYSLSAGFEHQSNGAGGEEEVSWNRAYLQLKLPFESGYLSVKPWLKLDTGEDYNPDISDFLGYGETELVWYATEDQTLKFYVRNALESGFDRGYYRLSWSFPIYQGIMGYAKADSGYGSTISNYNFRHDTFGVGFYFEF